MDKKRWQLRHIFFCIKEPVQLGVFSDITAEKEADLQLRFLNNVASGLLTQPDTENGINDILLKLLRYFDGDWAYIFKFDYAKEIGTNTYEQCAENITPEQSILRDVPISVMQFWCTLFEEQNFVVIDNVDDKRAAEKQFLKCRIYSLL